MLNVSLSLDCYALFDHVGEGVYYVYSVDVDPESIAIHGITPDNFVVRRGAMASDAGAYLQRYRLSAQEWENDAYAYLTQKGNNEAENAFGEKGSDPTYPWIAFLYQRCYPE